MVSLDWRVESRAGISLVEVSVENPTEVARRVRVKNCLDGPVWPPRREGVPEAGWDDGGFEGIVAPGERRALGYASPASPVEPPVEVVWTERAGATERPESGALDTTTSESFTDESLDGESYSDESTPEGVVRALGDPRPPGDAVPIPTPERDPAIPDAVESWLSTMEHANADLELTPEDRRALRASSDRLHAITDQIDDEKHSEAENSALARRSP